MDNITHIKPDLNLSTKNEVKNFEELEKEKEEDTTGNSNSFSEEENLIQIKNKISQNSNTENESEKEWSEKVLICCTENEYLRVNKTNLKIKKIRKFKP